VVLAGVAAGYGGNRRRPVTGAPTHRHEAAGRLLGAVESCPDGTAGVAAVDAPLVGDGANNVKAVMPGRIDHSLVLGTAVVLNLYPHAEVWADYGPDCEGAAGEAGAAVLGGVGGEFGGAQDDVVGSRASC
jgi:hypothetical protein